MYEIFEHTADLGLRIRAADLPGLFAEAGRGLLSVIVANPNEVRPAEAIDIRLSAEHRDYLLVDWLGELLFLFESRQLLLAQFVVQLADGRLSAVARGEPVDRRRHQLDHEVKAVTYHGLKVVETGDGWLAEVILDI